MHKIIDKHIEENLPKVAFYFLSTYGISLDIFNDVVETKGQALALIENLKDKYDYRLCNI